jgi:hypothetical protein
MAFDPIYINIVVVSAMPNAVPNLGRYPIQIGGK